MTESKRSSYQDLKIGIFFILLSWLLFSCSYLVSKIIHDRSNVAMMVFFAALWALL